MRLVRDVEDPLDVDEIPTLPMQTASTRHPPADQPDGPIPDVVHDADATTASDASPSAVDLPTVEALLFATHHPLTAGRLAEMLQLDSTKPIRGAIRQLNRVYEETGRAFRVEQVAGGYQMLTLPRFGDLLKRMHQKEVDARLSKPAMETLAIIAYKQPILRADIEAVRGVACGETIRSLMEKHLVKIAGRAEEPGRPILYGTTKRFLEVFGLNSLKDLPQPDAGGASGGAALTLVPNNPSVVADSPASTADQVRQP